jgi:hypothetical protein
MSLQFPDRNILFLEYRLSIVSINDLVKEEVQRQIDTAIESIPYDKSRMSTPIAKSRFQYKEISDFLLGFEYGHIIGICAWYYKDLVVQSGREVTKEEERQVGNEVSAIIVDRLPEIRQAILRTDPGKVPF